MSFFLSLVYVYPPSPVSNPLNIFCLSLQSKTHVHMCIDPPPHLLMPSASPFSPQKRPMQDTPDIECQEGVHMICRCRGFGPVSAAIRTSLMPSCQTVQRDFKSALQRMPSDASPHFMCSKAGSKGVGQSEPSPTESKAILSTNDNTITAS